MVLVRIISIYKIYLDKKVYFIKAIYRTQACLLRKNATENGLCCSSSIHSTEKHKSVTLWFFVLVRFLYIYTISLNKKKIHCINIIHMSFEKHVPYFTVLVKHTPQTWASLISVTQKVALLPLLFFWHFGDKYGVSHILQFKKSKM